MQVLRLARAISEEEADRTLPGRLLADDAYDTLLTDDADVYDRDTGAILLKLRRQVLPPTTIQNAYEALRGAAGVTFNRGTAAGAMDAESTGEVVSPASSGRGGQRDGRTRVHPLKQDGTRSNTAYARGVKSGIVGYFDRSTRMPYCRMTAFGLSHPEQFAKAMPLVRAVDSVFMAEMPDRYAAQKAMVEATSPDFIIHGTAFTTVTVNSNFQTAVHKDVGDLKDGFGVLTAFAAGEYSGCYFCLPEWRVAVDLRTGDVLLADVHRWHGNTPFHGPVGGYERLSCVFYYREKMHECGTAEEELVRAKRRKPGDPVRGKAGGVE